MVKSSDELLRQQIQNDINNLLISTYQLANDQLVQRTFRDDDKFINARDEYNKIYEKIKNTKDLNNITTEERTNLLNHVRSITEKLEEKGDGLDFDNNEELEDAFNKLLKAKDYYLKLLDKEVTSLNKPKLEKIVAVAQEIEKASIKVVSNAVDMAEIINNLPDKTRLEFITALQQQTNTELTNISKSQITKALESLKETHQGIEFVRFVAIEKAVVRIGEAQVFS